MSYSEKTTNRLIGGVVLGALCLGLGSIIYSKLSDKRPCVTEKAPNLKERGYWDAIPQETKTIEGRVLGESGRYNGWDAKKHVFTVQDINGHVAEFISLGDIAQKIDARITSNDRVKVTYKTNKYSWEEGDGRITSLDQLSFP